ncbi:capsid maturation protease [Arthrobacter phage EastWest]|uniref:Capsid maturation protease n=1 Tax=Arthrobacter phage EastWest TaxID=2894292 RepID=A0AAE8YK75_9CAUD|nr:capsid maturation protease [Arthrobacter phage EastWest]
MCDLCVTARRELLLAEAERELILAEADARESVPNAVRPLSKEERRAKVRFGDIDEMERTAESRAATALVSLRADVNDALLDELFGNDGTDAAPQFVADKLTTLLQLQPKRVQKAVDDATNDISVILGDVYKQSAAIVIEEAKRQGSNVDKLPAGKLLLSAGDSIFDALAAAVASYFWQRVTGVLQRELLSPATLLKSVVTRADVEQTLGEIDPAGALDQASQAIHGARGAGRYEQAAAFEPEEIWASELMDGRTCPACEKVDGKEYATLEEARVEYETGGYGACAGGARCRGTLIMIYGDPPERPAEPEPAPSPAEPAPTKPRRARKPKTTTPAAPAPAPELPTEKRVAPSRPVDPDGRQRYFSLRELPLKKSNEIKARPLDDDVIKHLTPAKRKAAKVMAKAGGLFDEAALVNPMRGKADVNGFGYTSNCSNCVTALELRRRGYDVNAAKIDVKGRYPRDFVDAWWKKPDGSAPSVDFVSSRRGLESWAADFEDGARGFVTCAWKSSGSGHVFSWEKIDGKIVYLEPQNPRNGNAEDHWKRIKPGSVTAVRVDNLVATDKLVQAVETKGAR